MPTVTQKQSEAWLENKVKIIRRFGTVTALANRLGCSTEAIRQAATGRCPGVAKRLKEALS